MKRVKAPDIEKMRRLYWDKKMALTQVADVIGFSDKTVEHHLKKNGYGTRTRSEAMKGKKASEKVRELCRQLGKSQTGEKHPLWKGRVMRVGYWALRMPRHPHANDGYVFEHRHVMEKAIGRYLCPQEVVHHVNGDILDNRPENLKLYGSTGDHSRDHGKERVRNGTHNNYISVPAEKIKQAVEEHETVGEISKSLGINKHLFYKKIKQHNLCDWYKKHKKERLEQC